LKVCFKNQTFSFELLRAIGYTPYAGADIGECLATAGRIRDGDLESWHVEWRTTADRVRAIAEEALAKQHLTSAREAFLRASNYYRTAEFFLHVNPRDPRILATWRASRACFEAAARLLSSPAEVVEIPFEQTTLPGYFLRPVDDATPRPTLIFHGGFDSIVEELYFAGAAAALRHGYNCLIFDGPGQGRVIREQGIPFRPNWETVVLPVVDYALTRPDVNAGCLVLMGMSLGGYLAARAAAFEPRLHALILFNGVYDVYGNVLADVPPLLRSLFRQNSRIVDQILQVVMRVDVAKRWALTNGTWSGGFATPSDYFQGNRRYTLAGIASRIRCPTLVCDSERDHFFHDARTVYDALTCPKDYVRFTALDGAEEHCQFGALSRFHQHAFDWLDEVIGDETGRTGQDMAPSNLV
jgi:pimeloyl-ACP methyl ester carboxylesterase